MRRLIAYLTVAAALTAVAGSAYGQMLDSLDRKMVDSALVLLKLRPDEPGFDKQWVEDDTFRLAVVEQFLSQPLTLPGYMDETRAAVDSFANRPLELLKFISYQLRIDPDKKKIAPPEINNLRASESDPIIAPIRTWENALEQAEPYRKGFIKNLDSLDLHDLMMGSPTMWGDDDDTTKGTRAGSWQKEFGFPADTSRKVDSDRLLDIMKKLNRDDLYRAGMIVLPAAYQLAQAFSDTALHPKPLNGSFPGVTGDVLFYEKTKWGTFVVGGAGDNVYSDDFSLIVDLGGDDIYRGRTGGAMGVLSNPFAVCVDLGGDDYYDSERKDVSQGAGYLGIGVQIDRNGNDTYRAANYSQGAGLFGIGVLIDHRGNDDFRGGYFMQGAGHCGIGLLINDGDNGDDRYLAATWAQGFASTYGYGLIYDDGGDDNYRCGGVYLHAPLLPHDNRSFSGGFGMGWRPRAGGGIGVLYDNGDGDDFYDAEVMSFGSSYWYSLGLLIDAGGNDKYNLSHYGLGSGIHLSVGGLYDVAGDDQYRSRWGVVGATPHDLSVGIMVDGGGEDYYQVGDGWGGSLTNSFGLFIDRNGNDLYSTRGEGTSLGNVSWARGFGGIAIFVDEEGKDSYPPGEPGRDSTIWLRNGGIGIDLPRDIVTTTNEENFDNVVLTAEDSARSIEEAFRLASQWEVGSARESVARGRKALLTKGPAAVEWVIENKLESKDGLEARPIEELFKAYPDTAGALLMAKLPQVTENEWKLRNIANYLSTLKYKPAVDPLIGLLEKRGDVLEKVRNTIIGALGQIGDKKAAVPISRFADSEKERRRLAVFGALGALKDSATIPTVVRGLDDKMFTVRQLAVSSLVAMGIQGVPATSAFIRDKDSRYPEGGYKALKNVVMKFTDQFSRAEGAAKYQAVELFETGLRDTSEQVRAECVDALLRVGGEATREQLERHMEAEYSMVVKSTYQRVRKELKLTD